MFERKGSWYRFSDGGVAEGRLSSFELAGFLDDEDSWYLSDPEHRPEEMFAGIINGCVGATENDQGELVPETRQVQTVFHASAESG